MLSVKTDESTSSKGLMSNLLKPDADVKSDKFSLLLESFSLGKTDKNSVLKSLEKLEVLTQVDTPKTKSTSTKSSLSQLFKLGQTQGSENLDTEEENFHPAVLKALPSKEIKQLIGEAKEYLKEQITLKSDVKELPKTLGGLIKLAEKSGIDVKSIRFDSLSPSPLKEEISQALKVDKTPLTQESPTNVAKTIPHTTSELVKPIVSTKNEKELAKDKPLALLLTKEGRIEESPREVLSTPSAARNPAVVSSSLSALLHGEDSIKQEDAELSLKVDGDKNSEKVAATLQTKTEQLSQKVSEAKQLINHMAQNIKESVENYKPPFTRIKMQLNPQKFGEMDVTMVQRGNNVHININANTSALTLMMQNAHELKSALSAQGLGDATMNFSSQQNQQQQQEKNSQQQGFLTYEEFAEFDEEITQVATALEIVVPRYI